MDDETRLERLRQGLLLLDQFLDGIELDEYERAGIMWVLTNDEQAPPRLSAEDAGEPCIARTRFFAATKRREKRSRLIDLDGYERGTKGEWDRTGWAMVDRIRIGHTLTSRDRELLREFRYVIVGEIDALSHPKMLERPPEVATGMPPDEGQLTKCAKKCLTYLRDMKYPVTREELVEKTDYGLSEVKKAITQLKDLGLIRHGPQGYYVAPTGAQ